MREEVVELARLASAEPSSTVSPPLLNAKENLVAANADLPLHESLAPLAVLLGTWRGAGLGEFPTVEPFRYEEEIRFWHLGTPFLVYAQRAWAPAGGAVLHSEMGFWRPQDGGRLDVALAHPLGVVEIAEGAVSGARFELSSTAIGRAANGEPVTRLERRYEVTGDTLGYEVWMATAEVPLAPHLSASLRRA